LLFLGKQVYLLLIFEISAKTGENAEKAFIALAREIVLRNKNIF